MNHRKSNLKEAYRVAYSQFRLSGHQLVIETGRSNRRGRGRLPVEDRLCACGSAQKELHVVDSCPLTANVRASYLFDSWCQLMEEREQFPVPEIIYRILSTFTNNFQCLPMLLYFQDLVYLINTFIFNRFDVVYFVLVVFYNFIGSE